MATRQTYALAPGQQIFWALHEFFPDSAAGNVAVRLRLSGPLRHGAMLAAIQRLARRFDIWRTHYVVEPGSHGEPVAVVEALDPYPIDAVDLSALPPADAETRLLALFQERLLARFDLTRGPMMRVSFARLSDSDHALQFCSHHIALDGVSLHDVLGRLLAAEYHAAATASEPAAPPFPGFAAFAHAERQAFSSPDRPSLQYFREHLRDAELALDLPTDKRRPRLRSVRGARVQLVLTPEQRSRLQARALELGGSLPDLLLGAFYMQLHAYSGQTDLCVGVANANRRDPARRDLFGCLVVTLPIRCQLHGDPSLRELLARVRAAKRSAYAHLDAGIDQLLAERAGAAGGARRSSSYQAVFNYMNYSLQDVHFEGLSLQAERPDPNWSAVDLSMEVHEQGGGLECTLEYATDLFEPTTAARYLAHYATLLESLARPEYERISQLQLLSFAERRAVLHDANATARPYPAELCLHEVLREAMQRRSNAPAVTDGHHELSHGELLARARGLALRLRAVGARPGARVVIMLEDPIDALCCMLATLEAGAAYVPLDPALPRDRLHALLPVIDPCAVMIASSAALNLPRGASAVLHADLLLREPAPEGELQQPTATPEDPAYVIFTSGSTGVPKGVVVSHRNVVSQLYARLHGYPNEPPLRMLLPHSFAFDAPIGGLYWTLAAGGTLVLPDAQARRDPAALARLIERFAVTHIDIVPSLHEELLNVPGPERLRSLTTVLIGGEACSAALAARHFERLPKARLYNEYGPTETTVYSTMHALQPGALVDPLPIGKPIANTRCYVLDARQQPCPLGVPGELYIGGAGVALGYLGDAQRSAERFLLDPFAGTPGARMYRTGDLVRMRPSFELEFLGRIDRQVKLRGFRIELGEIEAALLRRPEVARAVAVARSDGRGGHIDAFVTLQRAPRTPEHGGRIAAELRNRLRRELPAYMVPSHVQVLERIPLTQAGKVDLRALPEPASPSPQEGGRCRYIEPRTQTEQRLAQLWGELLDVPRVGMLDDFFELGGHSLLAVRMLSALGAREAVHVPLSAFIHQPTISHLGALMHRDAALPEESLIVPIQRGSRAPFWLPHPVGGHVVFARRLAVHLDPEQPLLGIQAQGLDGQREPLRTIEAMAERYLELIRAEQPKGPYYLGGHSLGGLIAFELAQRLLASGERIGMLALFDTPGPGYPRRTALALRVFDHVQLRARRLCGRLVQNGRREPSEREVEEYRRYDPLRHEPKRGALMDAIDRVTHFNALAATHYQRRPYAGPVHLFRAQQTPHWPGMRFDDPRCGWGPYAARIEVIPIECTHQNMMDEPGVSELGRELQLRLLECQAQQEPAHERRPSAGPIEGDALQL